MPAPLVSIGVPVYNGARHLRAALDSLLAQSHGDFELIVSDNASIDSSWELCAEYARRDPRVRTFRQARNLGVAANWNFVFEQASGRYFKWASASDVCAPATLERCLQTMRDDAVVLAFGRTCFIDDEGNEISLSDQDFAVGDERPGERFRRVCHQLSINNALNGLIRTAALRKTHLHRPYPHSDRVLMAELALYGRFVLLPELLLFRRGGVEHFAGMRSTQGTQAMFRPGAKRLSPFVNVRRHLDFLLGALGASVPMGERALAATAALRGLYWDRRGLREDLLEFAGRLAPTRSPTK